MDRRTENRNWRKLPFVESQVISPSRAAAQKGDTKFSQMCESVAQREERKENDIAKGNGKRKGKRQTRSMEVKNEGY